MAEKKLSDMSIEETFASLDQIIARMEDKNITLEESFNCYKAGMEALKSVNEKIDSVEKQVKMLDADGSIRDFIPEEDSAD